MVVIGRRDVRSNNSSMHNLPVLAKGPMRGTALVHPVDAQRLGLRDGAMARISSHTAQGRRSIDVQVHCSADKMPGVVSVPHGWGHDQPARRQPEPPAGREPARSFVRQRCAQRGGSGDVRGGLNRLRGRPADASGVCHPYPTAIAV